MTTGIYTLANDVVYDQLVALLNSIEENAESNISVCVIPFDDRLDRVGPEIEARNGVTLFNNQSIISHWEEFSCRVWQTHPKHPDPGESNGNYRMFHPGGLHRRFAAFDPKSSFERFVYMDADTLLMKPLDYIFSQLDEADMVVYDFQHKHPSHVYRLTSPRLFEVFGQDRLKSEIFCSGFFGSRRGLFASKDKDRLIRDLKDGDSAFLYPESKDQSVLNYMVMKSGLSVYNCALRLPEKEVTGNSVTSSHFEARDGILYDKGVRLTYLHYIGLSHRVFSRLCLGENIMFPYRDVFLHYRYLREPDKRPKLSGHPIPYEKHSGLIRRILRRVRSVLS